MLRRRRFCLCACVSPNDSIVRLCVWHCLLASRTEGATAFAVSWLVAKILDLLFLTSIKATRIPSPLRSRWGLQKGKRSDDGSTEKGSARARSLARATVSRVATPCSKLRSQMQCSHWAGLDHCRAAANAINYSSAAFCSFGSSRVLPGAPEKS